MRLGTLALCLLAGCAPEPPPQTPIQRGAALFGPVAKELGSSMASDLKAQNAEAFQRYLQEIGGKDEGDLVRKVADEVVSHYGDALSVSAEKESELKSGKYEDDWNLKKLEKALAELSAKKVSLPQVCQYSVKYVRSGRWKAGLPLEFATRLLEGELSSVPARR